ncbi:MAG: lysylphosphatidylglycerol synthase domain-containing protein, partial [Salibacteraceae bacterium]
VLAKTQKHPFEKLFGTVLAERLIDAVILMLITLLAIVLQFGILEEFLYESFGPILEQTQTFVILAVVAIVGIALFYVVWKFIQRSTNAFALTIRDKVSGLLDGFKTLKRMEGQAGFYLHTFLIWGSYVLMFVLTFKSLPETDAVPIGGMLASFVLGGISIVAVQGGLGAYPLAIMIILALYGVEESVGYAFGWIVWTAQTIMIILLGFISMLAMPLLNHKKKENVA